MEHHKQYQLYFFLRQQRQTVADDRIRNQWPPGQIPLLVPATMIYVNDEILRFILL